MRNKILTIKLEELEDYIRIELEHRYSAFVASSLIDKIEESFEHESGIGGPEDLNFNLEDIEKTQLNKDDEKMVKDIIKRLKKTEEEENIK